MSAEVLEPTTEISSSKIRIHRKFSPFLKPKRYKVAHGGRGGLKSWQIARLLIYFASIGFERILCTREVQKSLKESVHQLLSDQIHKMGLANLFEILETEIRGPHGSVFLFAGLSDQTVESLKSYEGVTKVWVEEARNVTKRSWSILIPTIRESGSEIWISFNPELDTDETYVRFVVNPPQDSIVIETTWRDNPWLSEEMHQERLHCKATESPEEYEFIWEGKCKPAETGAIWANEVVFMTKHGRIGLLPYEPMLRVHTIWDFGYSDAMAVIMVQRHISEIRVIDYIEERFKLVEEVIPMMQDRRYNWGYDFIPHDGYFKSAKSRSTIEDTFKAFGRKPLPVNQAEPKQAPGTDNQMIMNARPMLRKTYVDKQKCARLIECWKRWKRNTPKHGEPSTPIHDEYSHGCAATKYVPYCIPRMTNAIDDDTSNIRLPRKGPRDRALGGLG